MPAPRHPHAETPGSYRKPPLPKHPLRHHHLPPRPLHHRIPIPPDPKKPPTPPRSPLQLLAAFALWTLLSLLLLLIFLLVFSAIVYAWLRPHAPEFHLQSLNITTLTLTPTQNDSQLTTAIYIDLEVYNRNDAVHFEYDHVKVSVFDEVRLGQGVLPVFALAESNMAVVEVLAGVENAAVSATVGRDLARSFEGGRMVADVQVECTVDSFVGDWHTGGLPITAFCLNVEVSRLGSGFKPKCPVYLYGWIRLW